MRVLAFDPGTATTGYGVVEEAPGGRLLALAVGVILTKAGLESPDRIKLIYDRVNELIETHQPDSIATERLFFNKNETTALTVGRTIGVILLASAQHGLPWSEYTPPQVKKAITGQGGADKQQMQWMVTRLLSLKETPRPDDAADALAVAICHCHSARLTSRGVRTR